MEMFCGDCGGLLRPFNGKLICPRDDSEEYKELEQTQEDLIPTRGGNFRRRDTTADKLERRTRAIEELLNRLPGAHQATPPELRGRFELQATAVVILLKDGRSVRLCTNWTEARENPRFPYQPLASFDFVVFALTDNSPGTVTEWWVMRPEEVLEYWRLVGDDNAIGYVEVDDIALYHNRWERLQ